jgi:hypothetical protein
MDLKEFNVFKTLCWHPLNSMDEPTQTNVIWVRLVSLMLDYDCGVTHYSKVLDHS